MKNYFERANSILPFEKALYVLIDEKDRLFVCVEKGLLLEFPIGDWNNYKAWLKLQQKVNEIHAQESQERYLLSQIQRIEKEQSNSSEIPTSCGCSEKADDSNRFAGVGKTILTREQVKKIVNYVQKCYGYNGYLESDDFVEEINNLINEEGE